MPMISRRRILQTTSAATIAVVAKPLASRADALLDNLKIVCGYPPGGPTALVSRWVADKLAGNYAKATLVDNRPGAAGRIAVDALKSSPASGKAMLLTPSSVVTLYPHVYRQLSYDPLTDLTPVSGACEHVHGLAVGPAVPEQVRSVSDFVAWAKANCGNPGEGSLPTSSDHGVGKGQWRSDPGGSLSRWCTRCRRFAQRTARIRNVTDGLFLPYTTSGRARVIATSGPARSQFFLEVPTFAEQGLQHMVYTEWFGFFMPSGASGLIVSQAADAIAKALRQSDLIEAFAKAGLVAAPSTPAELAKRLGTELAYWGPEVKSLGFNPLE